MTTFLSYEASQAWLGALTYKRYWLSKRKMSRFVVRLCFKARPHTCREAQRDSDERGIPNNMGAPTPCYLEIYGQPLGRPGV